MVGSEDSALDIEGFLEQFCGAFELSLFAEG
jgi:hypothetical protein